MVTQMPHTCQFLVGTNFPKMVVLTVYIHEDYSPEEYKEVCKMISLFQRKMSPTVKKFESPADFRSFVEANVEKGWFGYKGVVDYQICTKEKLFELLDRVQTRDIKFFVHPGADYLDSHDEEDVEISLGNYLCLWLDGCEDCASEQLDAIFKDEKLVQQKVDNDFYELTTEPISENERKVTILRPNNFKFEVTIPNFNSKGYNHLFPALMSRGDWGLDTRHHVFMERAWKHLTGQDKFDLDTLQNDYALSETLLNVVKTDLFSHE